MPKDYSKNINKKNKESNSKNAEIKSEEQALVLSNSQDDLESISNEINTPSIAPPKRVYGRSVNDRVVELCNKLEALVEKGYNDSMAQTKPFGIYATSNLIGNFIKLIEVSRELELGNESGVDIYEIIAYAPPDLKEEFQGLWMKLLENYAKIKGMTIEEILKTKEE